MANKYIKGSYGAGLSASSLMQQLSCPHKYRQQVTSYSHSQRGKPPEACAAQFRAPLHSEALKTAEKFLLDTIPILTLL